MKRRSRELIIETHLNTLLGTTRQSGLLLDKVDALLDQFALLQNGRATAKSFALLLGQAHGPEHGELHVHVEHVKVPREDTLQVVVLQHYLKVLALLHLNRLVHVLVHVVVVHRLRLGHRLVAPLAVDHRRFVEILRDQATFVDQRLMGKRRGGLEAKVGVIVWLKGIVMLQC